MLYWKEFLLIGLIFLGSISWFVLPVSPLRNIAITVTTTLFVILFIKPLADSVLSFWEYSSSSSSSNLNDGQDNSYEENNGLIKKKHHIQQIQQGFTHYKTSLEQILQNYNLTSHGATGSLLNRIEDYRTVVSEVFKEITNQQHSRGKHPDQRVNMCLDGNPTRNDLIQYFELEEVYEDQEPFPNMTITTTTSTSASSNPIPIGEDGRPLRRILRDPIVDSLFSSLMQHRPEAIPELQQAHTRYRTRILEKLLGNYQATRAGMCRYRKRFDGEKYEEFEFIEQKFKG
jgi:hypothetical protein